MKKNIFILTLFFVIVACTNKTVSDYTSLKQKALEIPPDFQLLPPSDKTEAEAAEMASDTVKDTDLKNILLEGNDEDMSAENNNCLLYTSPSPRDGLLSRMPSSA